MLFIFSLFLRLGLKNVAPPQQQQQQPPPDRHLISSNNIRRQSVKNIDKMIALRLSLNNTPFFPYFSSPLIMNINM